jgi:hypothetical protein
MVMRMPAERSADSSTKSRFWTRGTVAFVVAVAVTVSLFVLWLWLNHSSRTAVKRAIEAIRASGASIAPEDFAPPEVADAENAAVVLKEAFALMEDVRRQLETDSTITRELGPAADAWPVLSPIQVAANRRGVARVLRQYGGVFQLVDQAASRGKCRYGEGYGVDYSCRHFQQVLELARLFKLRAFLHADSDEADAAATDVLRIFRLARTLRNEPDSLSYHLRQWVLGVALGSLAGVEDMCTLEAKARKLLIDALSDVDLLPGLTREMARERACAVSFYEAVKAGKADPREATFGSSRMGKVLFRVAPFSLHWDAARAIGMSSERARLAELPLWEAVAGADALRRRVDSYPRWRSPFTYYAGALLPHFPKAASIQALIEVTATGLACESYRSSHGKYPRKLEELVPRFIAAIPADPFTGEPLLYALRPPGFVVYSVGEDLADDGGVHGALDRYRPDVAYEGRGPRE